MKLLINDLYSRQVQAVGIENLDREKYSIVDSKGSKNHYCIGCFGCWLKTPGRCFIRDDFQTMGERLASSDEILIISKATFGGFSSAVKNVMDRSISFVSPFFDIRGGEMHHRERYPKHLTISAVFYGHMTEEEKETARGFVKANALNLNGQMGTVTFLDDIESPGSLKELKEVL